MRADDALMVIGLTCAVGGTVVLLHHVDKLYGVEVATSSSLRSRPILAHAVTSSERFKALQIVWNVLLWSAVCSIKFSFLFFFRNLIWRLPGRIRVWWWAVVIFNLFTATFCIAQFSLACPRSDEAGLSESSSPFLCLVANYEDHYSLLGSFAPHYRSMLNVFRQLHKWKIPQKATQAELCSSCHGHC